MDVGDQAREVIRAAYLDPSEVLSKKLARSLVTLVDSFGVRVEVIRERLADASRTLSLIHILTLPTSDLV